MRLSGTPSYVIIFIYVQCAQNKSQTQYLLLNIKKIQDDYLSLLGHRVNVRDRYSDGCIIPIYNHTTLTTDE